MFLFCFFFSGWEESNIDDERVAEIGKWLINYTLTCMYSNRMGKH